MTQLVNGYLKADGRKAFEYVLAENDALKEVVSEFVRPNKVLSTVMSDGYGESRMYMSGPPLTFL